MRRISELLKEEREKKGLILEDVARATRIKKEFLSFIEQGAFHKLPSESYALGYVRNYAQFLGLPEHKIAPLFRREYRGEKHEVIPHFRKTQHVHERKLFLSSKTLLVTAACIIVVGYIAFQYSSLFFGPQLTVTTPANGQKISGTVVQVKGKTSDPYATVLVEGEEAYVALDGSFQKSIYVFSGEKKITVVAKNRFGKQTEKSVLVKVE